MMIFYFVLYILFINAYHVAGAAAEDADDLHLVTFLARDEATDDESIGSSRKPVSSHTTRPTPKLRVDQSMSPTSEPTSEQTSQSTSKPTAVEWYVGREGESCNTVCDDYSKSCAEPSTVDWPLSCSDLEAIVEKVNNRFVRCSECSEGSAYSWYPSKSVSSGRCYYGHGVATCSASRDGKKRFCPCVM